jgi:ribosomal protein S27AE
MPGYAVWEIHPVQLPVGSRAGSSSFAAVALRIRSRCATKGHTLFFAYHDPRLNCGVHRNAGITCPPIISREAEPDEFCRSASIILSGSLDALKHF